MLLLVLILVLIAFGLLVVALLTGSVLGLGVRRRRGCAASPRAHDRLDVRRSAVRAGSDGSPRGGSGPGLFRPASPSRARCPSRAGLPRCAGAAGHGAGAGGAEATSRLTRLRRRPGASPSRARHPAETRPARRPRAQRERGHGQRNPQAAALPFGQAPDGDSTVLMPVVRPSGSAGRPSGAPPSTTSSSEVQARSVAETGPAESASPSLTKGSSSKSEVDIVDVAKAARGPGNSSAESWAGTRSAPDPAFGRDAGGPSERSRSETGSAVAAAAAGFAARPERAAVMTTRLCRGAGPPSRAPLPQPAAPPGDAPWRTRRRRRLLRGVEGRQGPRRARPRSGSAVDADRDSSATARARCRP